MNKQEFDHWLEKLFAYEYLTECIPNKEMHHFLLKNIDNYTDSTVVNILRCLLHSYYRPLDESNAQLYNNPDYTKFCINRGIPLNKSEYHYRLINDYEAWEGLTWILELVKRSPIEAIKALSLYQYAELNKPDFRIMGISQCIDIIEEKFIKNCFGKETVLFNLHPREFEIIIYKLYCKMGYDAILTKATRDGGKDVIAIKKCSDGIEKLFVECKRYNTTELTNDKVKAFGFTVLDDRTVSRGVLFTTVKVSSQLKDIHPRINIIDMSEVILLLNSYLGYDWHERLKYLTK